MARVVVWVPSAIWVVGIAVVRRGGVFFRAGFAEFVIDIRHGEVCRDKAEARLDQQLAPVITNLVQGEARDRGARRKRTDEAVR